MTGFACARLSKGTAAAIITETFVATTAAIVKNFMIKVVVPDE